LTLKSAVRCDYTLFTRQTGCQEEQTDAESFKVLGPFADGLRSYFKEGNPVTDEQMLVDKEELLTLSKQEMTFY